MINVKGKARAAKWRIRTLKVSRGRGGSIFNTTPFPLLVATKWSRSECQPRGAAQGLHLLTRSWHILKRLRSVRVAMGSEELDGSCM